MLVFTFIYSIELIPVYYFNRLFAETDTGCILGGSALGSRGVNCQEVGMKAAEELATSIKGKYCVDSYSQDQIIILMALARGKSIIKCGSLTEHTRTAIYVVEKLTNVSFEYNCDCFLVFNF